MRDVNDTYLDVKEKLINWHKDMKDLRKKKNREVFDKAKYINGESYYLFSARLQRLYKNAYPKHKIETSSLLRDKFLKTVPKSIKSVISAQMVANKIKNKNITWSTIQKCTRFVDAQELEKSKVANDASDDNSSGSGSDNNNVLSNDKTKEIVINVGLQKIQKDAATQDYRSISDNCERPRIFYARQNHDNYGYQNKNINYNNEAVYERNHGRRQYLQNQSQNRNSVSNRNNFVRPPKSLINRNIVCNYCGRLGHKADKCRTRLNSCYICGIIGHYAYNCKFKQNEKTAAIAITNNE